jgi:hypothetical protein
MRPLIFFRLKASAYRAIERVRHRCSVACTAPAHLRHECPQLPYGIGTRSALNTTGTNPT